MSKLILIGVDSLDPDLLVKYSGVLPNLTKIRGNCPDVSLKSIFPVDSIPAWATIYTGLNPGKHGLVKAFDVFDSDLTGISQIDINILNGKTFWDFAGKSGKRVCILYPLLGHPPWKVNGIMISRAIKEKKAPGKPGWITERDALSYPEDVLEKYDIPKSMQGVSGRHPGYKNLNKWAQEVKKILIYEADIGLKICKDEEWDLFFIYFSWLDIIQHRLWRFCDSTDPSYPGANIYSNVIMDFYKLIDEIIGRYSNLYSNSGMIIFSDHGHGIRPIKVINVNKVLRENGFFYSKTNNFNLKNYIVEKIKINLLGIANRFDIEFMLVDLSTKTKILSSISKNIYTSSANGESSEIQACLSDFAGIKSYPHGGIQIKRNNSFNYQDYENLRSDLIKLLLNLKDCSNNGTLIEWACKREELYDGPKVGNAYPDIVFELKDGYGVGWNMYANLIGKAYDHNLAPGGHKESAVFLVSNLNRNISKKEINLVDIAPTVLDLLGINDGIGFDGISILDN
jgi:predicted AlkP superfamily phosphohydrolase/phosphomutase